MSKPHLADEILEYLLRYPEAEDTVEGIAEWWMAEQQARWTVDEVREAMKELVAKGVVIETPAGRAGRPPRYALRQP
jgi:hypothetical protein